MARRRSSLSKSLARASRKALTGSSASYKTQAKRRARKALTGSSLTLKTQAKRRVLKSLTGSARPAKGCATVAVMAATVTIATAVCWLT